MIRQCPSCDLRFQADTELRDHLATDHGVDTEVLAPYAYAPGDRRDTSAEEPMEPEEPSPPEVRRYLLVANQTLGGDALMEAVRERLRAGPCRFSVLVPATRAVDYPASLPIGEVTSVWVPDPATDREAMAHTRERVRTQLERLRAEGAEADGEIGDPDPVEAVRKALENRPYDEIIISTLPARLSRWLRLDLPSRVQRAFDVPVTVITARE